MAENETTFPINKSPMGDMLRASEVLEDAGLRHCIVGDAIPQILGSDVVVCDLFIVTDDDQREKARDMLLGAGCFEAVEQRRTYFAYDDTGDKVEEAMTKSGWPGYAFKPTPRDEGPFGSLFSILVVDASAWGLDLSPSSFAANTFLLPGSQYRVPRQAFYLQGLIGGIANIFEKPGFNNATMDYLDLQYSYMRSVFPQNQLYLLPPEDQLFVEQFFKVPYRFRRIVCDQWGKVRDGSTSIDEARKSIPKRRYTPRGVE